MKSTSSAAHLLVAAPQITAFHKLTRTVHRPVPYPENPLILGNDFCDREKLQQKEEILARQKPHSDQHKLVLDEGKGFNRWFQASTYGRCGQVRSVIRNPETGLFQLYYLVHGNLDISSAWSGGTYAACYAESENGIHWTLPKLGRVEAFGTKENNILFPPGMEANVIFDEHDPDPRRRYKALLHPGPRVAFSADGLHWSDPVAAYVETEIGRSDGDSIMGWDARHQKYVGYFRPWKATADEPEGTPFSRKIGRAESDDFIHWNRHQCVLRADREDGPWAEIERMQVFEYGGMYFGLAMIYLGFPEERIVISHMCSCLYVELTYSMDGIEWHRFPQRDPFLSCEPGVRDKGLVLAAGKPVVVGDQLYFYYSASNAIHGEFPTVMRPSLARLSLDRFVGWTAGDEEGVLQTGEIVCPGGRLVVNADLRAGGTLRASIVLEDGQHEIEYAAYRCCHAQGDAMEHEMRWSRRADMETLKGRTVSIRFYLRKGEIFSYRFAGLTETPR